MSTAAKVPRIRVMVICDDVISSDVEDEVVTLEGVRHHLSAATFPCSADLNVYLLLSYPREGTFAGKIMLVEDRSRKVIRYAKIVVVFDENASMVPLRVDLGSCRFPHPGSYTFEVWFSAEQGDEAIKGEQPFDVRMIEE